MGKWNQQLIVSGNEDQAFNVYCEPEGAEIEVLPGDVLTFEFKAADGHPFELSWTDHGLVICKCGDSDVTIQDKRGRDLRW